MSDSQTDRQSREPSQTTAGTPQKKDGIRVRWRMVMLLAALLLVGAGAWTLNMMRQRTPDDGVRDYPLPPLSESRFLNVSADATYVGAKTCAECHKSEHRSYLRTQHAKAFSPINLADEPADSEYDHPASGRSYRIYRKGGQLWMSEFFRTGGKKLPLVEHPLRYLFGSGTNARTYAIETKDGFLIESPVTWYPAKKQWGMSPGYDVPFHQGFERMTSFGCVLCHVGRARERNDSPNLLTIKTQAIDCERCHGPGSLHVERWSGRDKAKPFKGEDLTIVHPGRLSRDKVEAICAQCHEGEMASVDVRGRNGGDFRPGLPLTDFRIDYDFKVPRKSMAVVGHFQQMRQSRCYQMSKELTCTTCHNPHTKPSETAKISYYRLKCLSCHDGPGSTCALDEKKRLARNANDYCISCHMPTTSTNVPHTAFVHHRIGLHKTPAETKLQPDEAATLVPVHDVSYLPKIDQDRCLGLAYWEAAGDSKFKQFAPMFDSRALDILTDVRGRGLRDGSVDAALSLLYSKRDPERALELAQSALGSKTLPPKAHCYALSILSQVHFRKKEWRQAETYLLELVKRQRDAVDWRRLSVCRYKMGNVPGALEAAQRAEMINPLQQGVNEWLAQLYQELGNVAQANHHRRRGQQLSRINQ